MSSSRRAEGLRKRWTSERLEFLDTEYAWFVSEVCFRPGDDTFRVTLTNGDVYTITRNLEFIRPPRIVKNGELQNGFDGEYMPALSTLRWLMTLVVHHTDAKNSRT